MAHARVGVDVSPPQRRRYGLFSVAPPVDNTRAASAGHDYEVMCGSSAEFDDPCESPAESPGESPGSPGDLFTPNAATTVEGDPFPIAELYECGLVGDNSAQARRRAEQVLDLTGERQVEAHLWSLLHAAGADCTVLASACEDVCYAVGALDQWLAQNTPGVGVIHAPIILEPLLSDGNMLIRNGARLETPIGTPIVLGTGYTANVGDADMVTVFATGPVHVFQGPVDTQEVIGHQSNTRNVLAQRAVSLSYECGCASALVNVCDSES